MITRTGRSVLLSVTAPGLEAREAQIVRFVVIVITILIIINITTIFIICTWVERKRSADCQVCRKDTMSCPEKAMKISHFNPN